MKRLAAAVALALAGMILGSCGYEPAEAAPGVDPNQKVGVLGETMRVYYQGHMDITVATSYATVDPSFANGNPTVVYDVTVRGVAELPFFNPGCLWLVDTRGRDQMPVFEVDRRIGYGHLRPDEVLTGRIAFQLNKYSEDVPASVAFWCGDGDIQAEWKVNGS